MTNEKIYIHLPVRFIKMDRNLELRARELSNKVVIALNTMYNPRDPTQVTRGELAEASIRSAIQDLGYRVVVTDGGSAGDYVKRLENHGATVITGPFVNYGEQKKRVIAEAQKIALKEGKSMIALTEPEKDTYFPEIWRTAEPIAAGLADVVVAERPQSEFERLPWYQQISESAMRQLLSAYIDLNLDYPFSPRTIRADGGIPEYFINDKGMGVDVLYTPLLRIHHDGHRITGKVIENFRYPEGPIANELNNPNYMHRRRGQLDAIWKSVIDAWAELQQTI